jgi:hypothetical protein
MSRRRKNLAADAQPLDDRELEGVEYVEGVEVFGWGDETTVASPWIDDDERTSDDHA